MKVLNDNLNNNFDILSEDIPSNKLKLATEKCSKLRKYFSRKCTKIVNINNKSVYIETLSVASAKRSIKQFYKKLFKNHLNGYEQLLTDEERRLTNVVDYINVVEGI